MTLEQYIIESNEQINRVDEFRTFIKKWAPFVSQNKDNPELKEAETKLKASLEAILDDIEFILKENSL